MHSISQTVGFAGHAVVFRAAYIGPDAALLTQMPASPR